MGGVSIMMTLNCVTSLTRLYCICTVCFSALDSDEDRMIL